VIVFSHGLGGSRTGYQYICDHLATHGYLVIVPTHKGSDTQSVGQEVREHVRDRLKGETPAKGVLQENTSDPENLKNRPADVAFVLDRLAKDEKYGKLADLRRVGVAGHSFGAYTAMVEGGMEVNLPNEPHKAMRDPRVKAVVPMSPEGQGFMGIDGHAWDHFTTPALFLTGTKDYGQGEMEAAWRREAFDTLRRVDRPVDAYLVVIKDAGHMTFAQGPGVAMRTESARDAALIRATTTAFFDAYVKGDSKAMAWLKTFAAASHEDCTAEFKAASAAQDEKKGEKK
jgi:predicted dienelactone hydrolase